MHKLWPDTAKMFKSTNRALWVQLVSMSKRSSTQNTNTYKNTISLKEIIQRGHVSEKYYITNENNH